MTWDEYPTVTGTAGRQFFDDCDLGALESTPPPLDQLPIDWITVGPPTKVGSPNRFDTRPVYDFARRAMREASRGVFTGGRAAQEGERFEAAFAVEFHGLLHGLPGAVLCDRGFWRFLAIGPLFSCVVWRQRGKNLPAAFGLPPASGRRRRERAFDLRRSLPWRLYMRAEIGGPDHVGVIGSDLWWSHLFRVDIGRSQPTAHAFLPAVENLEVALQRRIAPLVTADRGKFAFDALDDDEVAAHVVGQAASVAPTATETEPEEIDPTLEDETDDDVD